MGKVSRYDFAVIFDMDGVIVDSNPHHEIALRRFCKKHGHELSDDELRNQIFGRTNRDWMNRVFGPNLSEDRFRQLEEEKETMFRDIISGDMKPVNGLTGFLQLLRKDRIILAVATSAPPANVQFTLQKTGTESFFSEVIDGSMIERSKPDPEIYLKTSARIQYPPERCIVFEDSISGIKSAWTAGCRVIGITTTHPHDELLLAHRVIDDFEGMEPVKLADLFRLKRNV